MFEFEKQYKNYEQAVSRVLEIYEYWIQLSLSTIKDMVKTPKTK